MFGDLARRLIRDIGAILEQAGRFSTHAETLAQGIYFAYLGVLFSASGRTNQAPGVDSLTAELHTVFSALVSQGAGTR